MAADYIADRMYAYVLQAMDSLKITYSRSDEKRMIEFTEEASPFPIKYRIAVRNANHTISFFSELPFRVPDKLSEWFAKRLAQLVYDNLYVGTFDFNPAKGSIVFRTELFYQESLISTDTILLTKAFVEDTVTKYTEALFRLSRGEE